jgi:hypothetical protein
MVGLLDTGKVVVMVIDSLENIPGMTWVEHGLFWRVAMRLGWTKDQLEIAKDLLASYDELDDGEETV